MIHSPLPLTSVPEILRDAEVRQRHGRVEFYSHSDSITQNKGGAMVVISCDTEAGARTPEFISFAKKIPKYAYGALATCWFDIAAAFPDLNDEIIKLRETLREEVHVTQVKVMTI